MPATVLVRYLFIILAYISLIGCADEQFEANTDLKQFQETTQIIEKEQASTEDTQQKPATGALASMDVGDYLLGPGDLLQITVFETKELNAEVRVSSRGFISLPLLDSVDVRNLTAAEAEEKIETLLKAKYLQDPHVSVYIKEHVSKQITLVGSFKKPGTYDYVSKRKLLDVIAIAEGLSEKTGSSAISPATMIR